MNWIDQYFSGRKRQLSECSNFSEDDDEGEEDGMGNFTSTVCVNFSEDDLRLATIPGQVKVMDRDLLFGQSTIHRKQFLIHN